MRAATENNANYAFILTALDEIGQDGRAVFIMPCGILTTDNKQEKAIRKYLVEQNFIDCVITCPDKMFESTSGRYEKDTEGGAFYLGDCDEDDTCISMNLFVNAWMPLPEPYRPESKTSEEMQEWKDRMLKNFMKKGEM